MSALPTIEHNGKTYQRTNGKWLDSGFVSVPRVLAIELDRQAKNDPELWEQVEAKDFADNPRNRGSIRLPSLFVRALAAIESGAELSPQVAPIRGFQSSRPRRSLDTNLLAASFSAHGHLHLQCDLQPAWRETERSWRCGVSAKVELPGESTVTATVTVVEVFLGWERRYHSESVDARNDVAECSAIDSTAPRFRFAEATNHEMRRRLEGTHCAFEVPLLIGEGQLNTNLPWFDSPRKLEWIDYGIYELPIGLGGDRALSRPFEVGLKLILHHSPRVPLEPTYEFDTPLPSAGLPGQGKRR